MDRGGSLTLKVCIIIIFINFLIKILIWFTLFCLPIAEREAEIRLGIQTKRKRLASILLPR